MDVIKITLEKIKSDPIINRIKDNIADHQLIVYPTDTLYGLGGDPFSSGVIAKINELKGRDQAQGISIAVPDIDTLAQICVVDPMIALAYEQLLPGPVTLIVRADDTSPKPVVTPGGTIGIRLPDNPLTQEILNITGPLTATSANRHGGADPVDIKTARAQLGDEIALYLDGGPCRYKIASTILDLTGDIPRILREGVVPRKVIEHRLEVRVG